MSDIKMSTDDTKRDKFRRCLSLNVNQEALTPQSSQSPSFAHFRKMDVNRPLFSFNSPENCENNSFAANNNQFTFRRAECTFDSPMNFSGNGNSKIRKSSSCNDADGEGMTPKHVSFKRCRSETDAIIMNAVQRSSQDPSLIGDYSKPYALPLEQGRHNDLKTIGADTLAKVIEGEYNDLIDEYIIIDCRYPYEYDGGHIIGAKNIFTREGILNDLLYVKPKISSLPLNNKSQKSSIIIFHCEFSSERGPNLMRYLRNQDRECNKDNYPSLHYPEVYILDGGYKAFYERYKNLCEPQNYLQMYSKDHGQELRFFRAKAKSWNAGDGKCLSSVSKASHKY